MLPNMAYSDLAPQYQNECRTPCCVVTEGIARIICLRSYVTCSFAVQFECIDNPDYGTYVCMQHKWNVANCRVFHPCCRP